MGKRIRVLVAKLDLERYDRGAEIVARSFCSAGFEVILCEFPQTPEQVAEVALQEDVDAVALLLLSGMHNALFPKTARIIKGKGLKDVLVIGGGAIPQADISGLIEAGVAAVFIPGTPTASIVEFVSANAKTREGGDSLNRYCPMPSLGLDSK
ncbi:MAG: cobalamin-dependent protein [Sporomusaceae bacterium]|nr:cobalamin-dependent protein [Sporomusaceae bacterium]